MQILIKLIKNNNLQAATNIDETILLQLIKDLNVVAFFSTNDKGLHVISFPEFPEYVIAYRKPK